MRPNLEGCRHELFGLAGVVVAGGNLAPRLVELSFDFVSQFEAVFDVILKPDAELFQLGAAEARDRGFEFLNGAHARIIPAMPSAFKCQQDGQHIDHDPVAEFLFHELVKLVLNFFRRRHRLVSAHGSHFDHNREGNVQQLRSAGVSRLTHVQWASSLSSEANNEI